MAGILLGVWFVTAGLLITLMAYAMSKGITIFLFLIGGIAFSVMLIKGERGVLRRRSSSRLLLIISFYLACVGMIVCIFGIIIDQIKMGEKYFNVSSIGGIVFCLFAGTLFVLQAVFLNRPDIKELFKKE